MIRDKKRYILVEASSELGLQKEELDKLFKQAMMAVVGQLSYYEVSPKVVSLPDKNSFVVRCRLKGYDKALTATALIKRLGNLEVGLYTIKSSGTIKALMKGAKA
ncbi:MAG: Rpp14/Pop5 family protein [Candidatus Marsarchaeota archaeon]|nr:Rpp14/Pop5 family protein [Candidatus Marsarchaeota archaeon]MCL5102082.1 Rpp14/Pop5 family protein [Candidatus Marsarchaeota archaeon]